MSNPNVVGALILAFFYFTAFYLSLQPYFLSYMIVTRQMDLKIAGYIMNTFNMSCTSTIFAVAFATKYFKKWKPFLYTGLVLYTTGIVLMMHFRHTRRWWMCTTC